MGNLTIWITPVWVLSLGATAVAIVLLVAFGLTWLISRRTAESALRLVRESILQPISYVLLVLVVLSLIAAPIMPAGQVFSSLKRLTSVGDYSTTVKIPARTDDQEVPVKFEADELQSYSFKSAEDLIIGVEKGKAYSNPLVLVEGGETYQWMPSSKRQRLFNGSVNTLYVTNQSDAPTDLTINVKTDVPLVQVRQIPIFAAAILGIFAVYLLLHWLVPGISTIALATSKEAIAQPIYILALGL